MFQQGSHVSVITDAFPIKWHNHSSYCQHPQGIPVLLQLFSIMCNEVGNYPKKHVIVDVGLSIELP